MDDKITGQIIHLKQALKKTLEAMAGEKVLSNTSISCNLPVNTELIDRNEVQKLSNTLFEESPRSPKSSRPNTSLERSEIQEIFHSPESHKTPVLLDETPYSLKRLERPSDEI